MAPYSFPELFLFWSGLLALLVGGSAALGALLARRESLPHFPRMFVATGVILHAAFLILIALRTRSCPMFHLFEACVFVGALASAASLAIDLRQNLPSVSAGVALLAAFVAGAPFLAVFRSAPASAPADALLPFHIALVSLAYASFLLAFVSGLLYLAQERQLKRHTVVAALPALEVTNALNARAAMAGLVLLTFGLAFGFARVADKPLFSDGRVVMSLITWACYFGLVAMRLIRGYHGRSAARMSIWSFAVAAFTLFGASFLGSGVHRP